MRNSDYLCTINKPENDPIYNKLAYICKRFRVDGDIIIYRLIPSGHINTAYYVALFNGWEVRQFLVQKVNWYVFKDPISMMNNIDLITKHIMTKERTLERRRRLHFHHTDEGNNYLILDENGEREFWRLYNFVERSVSFESADGNANVLKMSGKAFGKFERQLQDFDAEQLVESIPHFHDTRYRLETFFRDVEEDSVGRVSEVLPEIEEIRKNRNFACTLCEMIDRGELPLRVTHNDTKTDNVLFDKDTLDPLVIIDLDTCMPGLACYDFGDTIRFAACTGAEDAAENALDLRLFRAFAEGYIGETAEFLTKKELDSMVLGPSIITLELASRFLDDYITGDKYFRCEYQGQNLARARSQLKLFNSMMENFDTMNKIIHEVAEYSTEYIKLYKA